MTLKLSMRMAACLAAPLCGGLALAADDSRPASPGEAQCKSQEVTHQSRAVTCSVAPAGTTRRYRLLVSFAGSHDDTVASIAPRLDGAALACEDGSKVRLMGEDGEVSLLCIFSIPARQAEPHVFESLISWSHAQYLGYALDPA